MSRQEIHRHTGELYIRQFKFLYISPERLDTENLPRQTAEDENQYDYGRRKPLHIAMGLRLPSTYLKIAEILTLLPGVPVLALTATAALGSSERYPGPSAFP